MKKLKQTYLRKGEHPMVLMSIFSCAAKKHSWTSEEIKMVMLEARKADYSHMLKTLQSYCE